MITIELTTIDGECREVKYRGLEAVIIDKSLDYALSQGATCRVRLGSLMLSGAPVTSGRDLRDSLVHHSRTILKRFCEIYETETLKTEV